MGLPRLRKDFPDRDAARQFLKEFAVCRSYWYVPKARSLNDESVGAMKATLPIIAESCAGRTWSPELETELLHALTEAGILQPKGKPQTEADRNALVRINKHLLSSLGFLWAEPGSEVVVTDAGLDLMTAPPVDTRHVVSRQIAKYQYPNPDFRPGYAGDFDGLLPHVFLLQVLSQVSYHLSRDEYELFLNLSRGHEDLERIVGYVHVWRALSTDEQHELRSLAGRIRLPDSDRERLNCVHLNASYQLPFHTYPGYLTHHGQTIGCTSRAAVDRAVGEWTHDLKVPRFEDRAQWFNYYGDPDQRPSWFTYLSYEIEAANTAQEAQAVINRHHAQVEQLADVEREQVRRKQVEKKIEDVYAEDPGQVEPGLRRLGRQLDTPIGRIDLLCQATDGDYVVVEVKVDDADDAAFGQLLRYIGWVHRDPKLAAGSRKVRGIILAGGFPDRAEYSRIGLLRDDYKRFIQFRKHGFRLENV